MEHTRKLGFKTVKSTVEVAMGLIDDKRKPQVVRARNKEWEMDVPANCRVEIRSFWSSGQ